MERTIVGFHQDEGGTWVAELSCLHGQHIRHQPPFRLAPWVLEEAGRASHVGTPIPCPRCDRAELPSGLEVLRSTPVWDESSMPAALRAAHRVGPGTWGRLKVQDGRLRFRAATDPPLEVEVGRGEVEPLGPVRFLVEFLGRAQSSGMSADA
jgi:tellurite methyltransferase